MRTVVQRVASARVTVAGEVVGELPGPGVVCLVGVTHDDGLEDAEVTARKVADLRILSAGSVAAGPGPGASEVSAADIGAPVLVVSQFTLYADIRKGRRPSWNAAAPGPVAEPLVEAVVAALRKRGLPVSTGRFGADMQLALVNDGPVTVVVETSGGRLL